MQDLVARLPGSWHITLSTHPDPRGFRVGFLTRTAPTSTGEIVYLPAPLQSATP